MSNIARSLKDADYLLPAAISLRRYLDDQRRQEGIKQFTALMDQLSNQTKENFKPTQVGGTWDNVQPTKEGFDPSTFVLGDYENGSTKGEPVKSMTFDPSKNQTDYNVASNKTRTQIFQTLNSALANPDINPTDATNRIGLFSQLMIPGAPPKRNIIPQDPTKRYGYYDDAGNFTETQAPVMKQKPFDVKGKYLNRKTGTYWDFNKQTGDYQDTGIPYPPQKNKGGSGSGNGSGGENDYNYSNLYSNVQEGLKEIKKLKNTFGNLKPNKKGQYEYFPAGATTGMLFNSPEELNQYKEEQKKKYANDAEELVNQLGLDGPVENTAIKNIRANIQKGYSVDEALKEFKKVNPEFPEKELNIMKDYFNLLTL